MFVRVAQQPVTKRVICTAAVPTSVAGHADQPQPMQAVQLLAQLTPQRALAVQFCFRKTAVCELYTPISSAASVARV